MEIIRSNYKKEYDLFKSLLNLESPTVTEYNIVEYSDLVTPMNLFINATKAILFFHTEDDGKNTFNVLKMMGGQIKAAMNKYKAFKATLIYI